MPSQSEYNQWRRLVGDFPGEAIEEIDIDTYLDDAVQELTADFTNATGASAPVADFDLLVNHFRPEVVVWAARNWWWQRAAQLSDRHSQTVGQSSQNVDVKWDRALEMIRMLEARFLEMGYLSTEINMGHLSRFSKKTLTRIGGRSEESYFNA